MVIAIVTAVVTGIVVAVLVAGLLATGRERQVHGQVVDRRFREMGSELRRITELVATLRRERAEQHGQLVRGLSETTRATAHLADTAQHLREALASPKARGQWGERMADDVLRGAGFVEGVNYRRQKAIAGGTIPDFTFLLPQGVALHMDVKFPVDNYLRHLEAHTPAVRDAATIAFLRDVRARIKELAGRGYADPATTAGFVLLFIPNESVYSFIHEHDPGLGDAAIAQRVVLCSPFTLFAVLAVIRQAIDSFRLQHASDEILDALAGFSAQWDKFAGCLDTLGSRLASVQKAYDEVAGTRRRQIERHLDAIDDIRLRRGGDTGDAAMASDVEVLPLGRARLG